MKDRLKKIRKNIPEGKTQESFAAFLGIPKENISSYEVGRRKPSDAFINLVCEKCNVNYDWLVNGTGEMFQPISKDDEISMLFGKVLKDTDDNFRRRLVKALAKLDEDGWKHLEDLIDDISSKN